MKRSGLNLRSKRGLVAILAVVMLGSVLAGFAVFIGTSPPQAPSKVRTNGAATFTFSAVGDYGGINDAEMVAMAKRMHNAGLNFTIALGDLGYTSDEQGWCSNVKSFFNSTIVIAGNHDTTESGPGDITNDVIYCPASVLGPGIKIVAGPNYGYGISYYFDYPASAPLARFIMVTAGITASPVGGQNYASGGAEYKWVTDAVNESRAAGIPWVIVGEHKLCITAATKSCEPPQSFWDQLVRLKVDVFLTAHDHMYQRSKQLALSNSCTTVSPASYNAACVVADGANGTYQKGAGLVQITTGTGGQSMYNIGTKAEKQYFIQYMGGNQNTQNKTAGWGYTAYTVTADSISAATSLCPTGSTGSDGECASSRDSTFEDAFTIVNQAPREGPTARFTYSPAWPKVNQSITFDASGSSDPNPNTTLQFRWDWTNDGTWDTPWSGTKTAQYAYAAPGRYTVRLEVNDSAGLTNTTTQPVTADSEPPTTTHALSGTAGSNGWYKSTVSVTLTATDDLSGVAATKYRKDGGASQSYSGPISVSGDGTHSVEYNSTDNAGNTESPHTVQIKIDTLAPSTSATVEGTRGNGSYYIGPVNVTLTATDATSGPASTQYRVDGGAWQTYTSKFVVAGNGSHTVTYDSTDVAGNTETAKTLLIQIGSGAGSPPTTTLSVSGTAGSNGWYASTVTIFLNATSPSGGAVTIHYRLDGGNWVKYSAPFRVADGSHLLEYNATDANGIQESTNSATIRVDTLPPQTVAGYSGTPSATSWYTSAVSLSLTASDAGSGVAQTVYRRDGGAWTTYASPVPVPEGQHTFEFQATDVAGLTEGPQTTNAKVDTIAPTLSNLAPTGYVHKSNVTITWMGSDGGSGISLYEASVDGAPFQSFNLATGFSLHFTDGGHNVWIRATDVAGNTVTQVVSFRVDTNAFSLTGPYSVYLPYFLVFLVILAIGLGARRRHRRRVRARAFRNMRTPTVYRTVPVRYGKR